MSPLRGKNQADAKTTSSDALQMRPVTTVREFKDRMSTLMRSLASEKMERRILQRESRALRRNVVSLEDTAKNLLNAKLGKDADGTLPQRSTHLSRSYTSHSSRRRLSPLKKAPRARNETTHAPPTESDPNSFAGPMIWGGTAYPRKAVSRGHPEWCRVNFLQRENDLKNNETPTTIPQFADKRPGTVSHPMTKWDVDFTARKVISSQAHALDGKALSNLLMKSSSHESHKPFDPFLRSLLSWNEPDPLHSVDQQDRSSEYERCLYKDVASTTTASSVRSSQHTARMRPPRLLH